MIAFEEIKQDEANYKKLSEKIFSTNYTEGLQELLTAIKETESYFFSYNQDKSIFTPQQRLQISEKLLSRVNDIKKFIHQTDNNYSLDNDAYCEAMHPVFVLEGELLTEIKNLKVYVEIISEAIPHEPAEPEKNKDQNFWSITPEEKHNIFTALNDKKILKYSGKGKPVVSMKNALYVFKALHNLHKIEESLIYNKSITKKETWKPDFIISEFTRDKESFTEKNISDMKSKSFEKITPDYDLISKIESIIQSALTA